MKSLLFLGSLLFLSLSLPAQFVARMLVEEPIEGICDEEEVYSLFPMLSGQEEAICPVSETEILRRLNEDVPFLKEHPKHKDKGMMGMIINCEGEVVQCQMNNHTKSKVLDQQMEAVFANLGEWKTGKLSGKAVDSSRLFSFKIKKGKVSFD